MLELTPSTTTKLDNGAPFDAPRQAATITFPVDGDHVLLGIKKRGYGVGYVNGFGGKLRPGETPLEATVRELEEESNLKASRNDIEPTGILTITGNGKPVVIYLSRCLGWKGMPEETEALQPAWFSIGDTLANGTFINRLPLDKMWPNDRLWIISAILGHKACYDLSTTNGLTTLQTARPHADDPWQFHESQLPGDAYQHSPMQRAS